MIRKLLANLSEQLDALGLEDEIQSKVLSATAERPVRLRTIYRGTAEFISCREVDGVLCYFFEWGDRPQRCGPATEPARAARAVASVLGVRNLP